MRILYGVNGQGFGHAMRSKVIIEYLLSRGHEVKVVCFKQSYDFLKQFFDCVEISGLELVYENNKISYLKTAFTDAKKFPQLVKSFHLVKKLMSEWQPDFVFTDYEPTTSLLAKIFHKPCISIGNHHFITRTKISYPKKKYFRDYITIKMINDAWTPFANLYIITTFAQTIVKNKKTVLVPPIVPLEVLSLKPTVGDYSVVYLTAPADKLLDELRQIASKFIVYGFDKEETLGNITLRKFSREGFLADLKNCQAVIANAGFSLISEALSLGKPYFALPIAKQFEQIVNAIYIKKLGYGDFSEEFEQTKVQEFLTNLKHYQKNLVKYPRQDNRELFETIEGALRYFSR